MAGKDGSYHTAQIGLGERGRKKSKKWIGFDLDLIWIEIGVLKFKECACSPSNGNKFLVREYGSALYLGLGHTVPPTNTNFRITVLLTRLQEALHGDIPV